MGATYEAAGVSIEAGEEAVQRINQPAEILAGPMLVVATIGLVVNLIGAYALWSGDSGDSNLRGALLHVVGDLLGAPWESLQYYPLRDFWCDGKQMISA